LPIKVRGRPGHEKLASPGHAVEAGVSLSQEPVYPPPYDPLTRVEFESFYFYLVFHEPRLVRNLTSRGVRMVRLDRLEGLLADASKNTPPKLQCHLWFLREYYFASNPDPARRERIEKAAAALDTELKSIESLILEHRSPSALGYAPVRSISPEPRARVWTASGDAPRWRHEPLLPDQGLTIGQSGPVVFTSTDSSADESVGSLASEPFTVDGDIITFPIAGGMDAHSLTVSLVIDGKPVRTATGCRSEWLGTRTWDVKPFRGARATIMLTDDSKDDLGHLVVGTITEWRGPS
jgi:hypothetical protein